MREIIILFFLKIMIVLFRWFYVQKLVLPTGGPVSTKFPDSERTKLFI